MHVALVAVLVGLSAGAQSPDEPPPPPPPPVVEAPPTPPPPPIPPSLFGARVIGRGRVLYGLSAWYAIASGSTFIPALRPTVGFGLGGGFDVTVGLDVTLPPWPDRETMEAVELTVRRELPKAGPVDLALTLELLAARFGSKESAENLAGPRHTTGLRDLNAGFGLPMSFGPRATYTVKPFVIASFDLQPASNGPLTGAPPQWTLGWTVGLDAGYELAWPITAIGALRIRPGARVLLHTRPDDKTVTLLSTLTISGG
ncbi:MAG: hypothetical protein QM723_06905 [Myxococcaceae bacterium]